MIPTAKVKKNLNKAEEKMAEALEWACKEELREVVVMEEAHGAGTHSIEG